jgi:endonuclease YncB( thermonuclease family)
MEASWVKDIKAVDRVIDGSTFIIELDLGLDVFVRKKLRLINVRCHSPNVPQGIAAKEYVEQLIKDKRMTVKIFPDRFRKYSTLLGVLYINNGSGWLNLNDLIIKENFGWLMKNEDNPEA